MSCGFPYCGGSDCECVTPKQPARCDDTRYCEAWPNCSPPGPVIAKETPGKIEGFRYIETAYVQPETVNSGVGGGVSNG